MADLKAQLVEAIAGMNDRAPERESMQRMKDEHEQEILSLKAEIEAQRAIHEANLAAVREEIANIRIQDKESRALIVSPRAPLQGPPAVASSNRPNYNPNLTQGGGGGANRIDKKAGSAQIAMAAAQMISALAATLGVERAT